MNRNSYLCDAHRKEAALFCLCGSDPLFLCPTCLPKHEGHDIYPVAQSELLQAIGRDKAELKRRNILSQKCQTFFERVMDRETSVQTQAKALITTVSQIYDLWLVGNHRCFDSLLTTLREGTALLLTRAKYRVSSITQKLFEKLESSSDSDFEQRFIRIPEIETLSALNEHCQEVCSRASKVWQTEYEEETLQQLTSTHLSKKRNRSPSAIDEESALLSLKLDDTTRQLQALQADFQAKVQECLSLEKEKMTLTEFSQSQVTEMRVSLEKTLKRVSELKSGQKELNLKLETTNQELQTVQLNYQKKCQECEFLIQEQETLRQVSKEAQVKIEETLNQVAEMNRQNSILESRLEKWKVLLDPPEESLEPTPDYSTPQSKAALTTHKLPLEPDNELLLIKRGPISNEDGVYTGQWNTLNEYHVYGQLLFKSGGSYEGQWRNGNCSGKGRLILKDGVTYIGDFVHSQREGFGTLYFANGDEYSGGWVNGLRHGVGSWGFGAAPRTADQYIGEYLGDKKHGIGAMFRADGSMYVGSWKAGEMHGKGLSVSSGDGSMYYGDFADGLRAGTGCYLFPDGDVYRGQFELNERSGYGRLMHVGSVEKGVWVEGVLRHRGY